ASARRPAAPAPRPAAFERRRACEAALYGGAPSVDLYAALGDPDRSVRAAARIGLEKAPPADLAERVSKEGDPLRAIEGALIAARVRATGATTDALVLKLGPLCADPARAMQAVRAAEVAILRPGDPSPKAAARFLSFLRPLFPGGDELLAREVAVLFARLAPERAIPLLAAELGRAPDREQALDYAWCASALERGWTAEAARAFLAWFEEASSWSGGASFQGYVAAMRSSLLRRLSAGDV